MAALLRVNGFEATVLTTLKQQSDGSFVYVDHAQAKLWQHQDWCDVIDATAAGSTRCKSLLDGALRTALPDMAAIIA